MAKSLSAPAFPIRFSLLKCPELDYEFEGGTWERYDDAGAWFLVPVSSGEMGATLLFIAKGCRWSLEV